MGVRRALPLAILALLSVGTPLNAQERGTPPKEAEVFSLEPVTVTAPWPLIPPQYKEVHTPPYPEAARAREKEGTVFLLLLVRPDGSVGAVKVQKSSGHRLLDEAATQAAKTWTFIPARRGPAPIEAWAEVPVKFELK